MSKTIIPKIRFYLLSLLLLSWILFLLLEFYLYSVVSKTPLPKDVVILLIPIVSPLLGGLWISEYARMSGIFLGLRVGGIEKIENLELGERRLSKREVGLKGKILLYTTLFASSISVALSWYFFGFLSWFFTIFSAVLLILIIFVIPKTKIYQGKENSESP